jgi:hypothetical protein
MRVLRELPASRPSAAETGAAVPIDLLEEE